MKKLYKTFWLCSLVVAAWFLFATSVMPIEAADTIETIGGGVERLFASSNGLLNNSTYTIESDDITLGTPTRDGYKFIGWTGSNGDTPELNITIPKGSIGDKSFIANWEEDGIAGPVLSGSIRADNGKPQIRWTSVNGASKYMVYRSEDNGVNWEFIYETSYLSYTNTSAVAGRTYSYKVLAVVNGENSRYSNVVTLTTEIKPPTITGVLNDDGYPHLDWQDMYVDYYNVYRSTDGVNFTLKWDTKETQGVSYTNTDAEEGKTYWYKVTSVMDGKESGFSNTVSISVPKLVSYAAVYDEIIFVLGKSESIPKTFEYELDGEVKVGQIGKWNVNQAETMNVQNVQDMSYMFTLAAMESDLRLDLSPWNVLNVTKYSNFNAGVQDKIISPKWVN